MFWWNIAWLVVFIIGCTAQVFHPFSKDSWIQFWLWKSIWIPLPIGIITTIWFTIGCTRDMRTFFRTLRGERVDLADDGTVSRAQDLTVPEPAPAGVAASSDTEAAGD